MSRKAEVAYLLFTCVVFFCLAVKPEWLAIVVLRGREMPNVRVLRAIRIGSVVCGASALLTLIL